MSGYNEPQGTKGFMRGDPDKKECKHEWADIFEDKKGYSFRECVHCGIVERLVANGPDDCEWVETD